MIGLRRPSSHFTDVFPHVIFRLKIEVGRAEGLEGTWCEGLHERHTQGHSDSSQGFLQTFHQGIEWIGSRRRWDPAPVCPGVLAFLVLPPILPPYLLSRIHQSSFTLSKVILSELFPTITFPLSLPLSNLSLMFSLFCQTHLD